MDRVIVNTACRGSFLKSGKTALRLRANNSFAIDDGLVGHVNNFVVRRKVRMHKDPSSRSHPLYRMLDRSVGQPWDDVFAEICNHVDSRSSRGYHLIHDHLMNYLVDFDGFDRWRSFFVDDNGILQRRHRDRTTKYYQNLHLNQSISKIQLSETETIEKIDGHWYHLRYVKHDPHEVFRSFFDHQLGRTVIVRWGDRPTLFELVSKKSLNAEQLKTIRTWLLAERILPEHAGKGSILLFNKKDDRKPAAAIPAPQRHIWQ